MVAVAIVEPTTAHIVAFMTVPVIAEVSGHPRIRNFLFESRQIQRGAKNRADDIPWGEKPLDATAMPHRPTEKRAC